MNEIYKLLLNVQEIAKANNMFLMAFEQRITAMEQKIAVLEKSMVISELDTTSAEENNEE